MKVLIADDHSIVREGLKQIVARLNKVSTIDETGDDHEALAKIEENKYDLVILDISMPGLSGMDILKIMKDRNETAQVLILSIHPQEQYAIRAFNLGASGYICKDSVYFALPLVRQTLTEDSVFALQQLQIKLFKFLAKLFCIIPNKLK